MSPLVVTQLSRVLYRCPVGLAATYMFRAITLLLSSQSLWLSIVRDIAIECDVVKPLSRKNSFGDFAAQRDKHCASLITSNSGPGN